MEFDIYFPVKTNFTEIKTFKGFGTDQGNLHDICLRGPPKADLHACDCTVNIVVINFPVLIKFVLC